MTEIEGPTSQLGSDSLHFGFLQLLGYFAEIDDRQINSHNSSDLLYGLTTITYGVSRSQHFVSGNNGSERVAKRIEIEYAIQAKRRGFVQGGPFSLQLIQKPQTPAWLKQLGRCTDRPKVPL